MDFASIFYTEEVVAFLKNASQRTSKDLFVILLLYKSLALPFNINKVKL